MPKQLDSLMEDLQNRGVAISGSEQRQKLRNVGYYHGYKGYRFAGNASNRLPLTDFSQVAALYDFDLALKSLFYQYVISIETALKNYTLEAVLEDAASESFDDIWNRSLTGYRDCSGKGYSDAWGERYRLRREIDGIIYYNHKNRDVIAHFCNSDKDVPIWAIFEVMTLGNFGAFYKCLSKRVKTAIVNDLNMPTNLDSERRLQEIIFTLKDFRNAIAHNGVVLDVRFKSGSINKGVTQLIEQEIKINGVNFTDITDYVILLVYLMTLMSFTTTEREHFISEYEAILERFRSELPFNIYSKIIKTTAQHKLMTLRNFVCKK